MSTKKINNKLILPFVLGIPFLFIVAKAIIEDHNLSNDGIMTSAVITGYKHGYRGYLIFKYQFYYEKEVYTGQVSNLNLITRAKNDFIGRSFPVLFKKDDPSVNELLMSQVDFRRFNKPFPDSLRWVMEYQVGDE